MAVDGAQAAADQDEGALRQAGSICEYGSSNKAFVLGGRGRGISLRVRSRHPVRLARADVTA